MWKKFKCMKAIGLGVLMSGLFAMTSMAIQVDVQTVGGEEVIGSVNCTSAATCEAFSAILDTGLSTIMVVKLSPYVTVATSGSVYDMGPYSSRSVTRAEVSYRVPSSNYTISYARGTFGTSIIPNGFSLTDRR